MQTPLAIYLASILGAVGLLLIMPKRQFNYRAVGAVLGAGALGGLWFFLSTALPEQFTGIAQSTFIYYYLFSAIAVVAAVRVITHTRPVYSALWFVLVVLSTAGLLIVLSAEFMAFAMIIIYAGAILVTYMFVIMLASQSAPDPGAADDPDISPDYDRLAREPVGAIVAGFLLLAVLLTVVTEPTARNPQAAMESDEVLAAEVLTERPGLALQVQLQEQLPADLAARVDPEMAGSEQQVAALGQAAAISNVERVGLDLFRSHPLGLELAGVILLVSLIGAVVIAKTRVEEEESTPAAVPDETGASIRLRTEPGPHARETHGQSGGRVGT